MELYYEKPFVKISWDEEVECIFMEWKGFSYGEELRTGMNKMLELAKAKKATKTLVDLRKMRVMSQEDQEWLIKDWNPRARAIGLSYTATLVPESALARAGFDKNAPIMADEIQMKSFATVEEARKWLRSL